FLRLMGLWYCSIRLFRYLIVRCSVVIYSLRKEVDIMDYISVKAASEKWGISERRIQKLCEENRIDGTEKFGRAWMIPKDAEKPVDGRMKTRNKQEENHGI